MRGNYDSIAENYHRFLVPLFFEPYAVDLAQSIQGSPISILELACGTGITTRYIISKLPEKSVLFATDLKPEMLSLAQSSIQDPRIHWQIADAHHLPFFAQTMDLVICQFGVMFFPDKQQAFAEVFRVLKPKGSFIFNTWDALVYNDISNISQQVLEELYNLAAPDFSQKGPYSFFDSEEINRFLLEAGFTDILIQKHKKISENVSLDDIVTGIAEGSPLTSYFLKYSLDNSAFKTRFREKLVIHFEKSAFNMQAIKVIAKK